MSLKYLSGIPRYILKRRKHGRFYGLNAFVVEPKIGRNGNQMSSKSGGVRPYNNPCTSKHVTRPLTETSNHSVESFGHFIF
jgi:hypothetical protein